MMNRIILIGNGFDLAHKLQTSYRDFIKNYWTKTGLLVQSRGMSINKDCKTLRQPLCKEYEDELIIIKYSPKYHYHLSYELISDIESLEDIRGYLDTVDKHYTCIIKNAFFRIINQALETKNWVDIEIEYYRLLKNIIKATNFEYNCPQDLNSDFLIICKKIIKYIRTVQCEYINESIIIEDIRRQIFEPFNPKDIANEGRSIFNDFLMGRLKLMSTSPKETIAKFLNKYGYSYLARHSDIDLYNDQIMNQKDLSGLLDTLDYLKHIENVYENKELVPDLYLLPDQILFLNFNYTSTADLYIPKGSEFTVNHIHGELDNDKNPIIFGYGDELDEDYKAISNLNDNSYLMNIKSIRYLETDNYRKLLSFIDSAPFQIYIMGHSCGNSDRTLLNTLFEHKNCVSIKPFYHLREDGSDNYIEIIQNISRNFNDMRLMRDRVVNKTYCRPLVEIKK